ncbi:hypothetical protein HAX54_022102 [Datura stramonium]|uniref:Uncharacterized protein n=1 Tax=Datura stramonium TaxID=4076 RepID=A0ABS8UWQ3_DATST|nr:hypothetical protein [Datura stramonium]
MRVVCPLDINKYRCRPATVPRQQWQSSPYLLSACMVDFSRYRFIKRPGSLVENGCKYGGKEKNSPLIFNRNCRAETQKMAANVDEREIKGREKDHVLVPVFNMSPGSVEM